MSVSLPLRALLLTPLLLLAGPARAERDAGSYLGSISGLFDRGEFETALEVVKKARGLENKTVETEASLALWEGLLLAHRGKKEESTPPLEAAFLLEPDVPVPARLSPKIRERVESIRARVKEELARRPPRKHSAATTRSVARSDAPRLEPGTEGQPEPPAPPTWAPAPEVAARPSGAPVIPLVLCGVAVASGAAAGFLGLEAQRSVSAARDAAYQDETVTALTRASSQALGANVAFTLAGAAAVAALVTVLVSR